jgi:3-keto-L-gulonate-6-phosphate decarboxylase
LFHYPHELGELFDHLDDWETVKGNTDLPIFVGGRITMEQVKEIVNLKPRGIVIGEAITRAANPEKEAELFRNILKG